jgi:uncharacterized phage infection (PIP) family protein YhgE
VKNYTHRPWLSLALVAAVLAPACTDDSNDYGAGKTSTTPAKATKDVAQATKDAGKKAVDDLKIATDGLERFGNSLQESIGDAAFDTKAAIEAKLPEVNNLAEKVKARLNAGDADMRDSAAKLDEKMTEMKTKLAALGNDASTATKDAKEAAADAFKSLVDNLQNGIKKLD